MAYSETTRETLRGRIRERLLDTFWTDEELNLYINEALRVWNVLTSYHQTRTNSAAIVGSVDGHSVSSSIASDCLIPLRFVDQTTKKALKPISLTEIRAFKPNWLSETSGTVDKWIPVGLDRFFIHPITTSNNLRVDYLQFAPLPSTDADYIQVGEEDMSAIVDYVTFIARLKEGGVEFQAAMVHFKNFLTQAAKHNSKITKLLPYKRLLGMPAVSPETRPEEMDKQSERG